MGLPDWLWQGLTVAAIWETGRLAVKHRHEVADWLRDVPYLLPNSSPRGWNETATLYATASARVRVTHDPFTGEWITSRIPLDS